MTRSAQLFAYEVDTHDASKINSILTARGVDPNEMTQLEYLARQVQLQAKLIRDHVMPRLQHDVVPVFLGPAFFFTWRDGLPYDRATFSNSLDHFRTVSSGFPRVLWVVGTIWWKEAVTPAHAMVHNSALVLQDGQLIKSLQKSRLSHTDELAQGPEVWDRWDVASSRTLDKTADPIFTECTTSRAGTPDITIGIEVGVDHLTLTGPPPEYGMLRTQYLEHYPSLSASPGVDIHLVVAAGMPMQPENITARTGGAYFRCDGGLGARRSQSVAITRAGSSPSDALRQWDPITVDMTPTYIGTDPDDRLAIYDAVPLR